MGYPVRAYDETLGQPRRPVTGLRAVSRQTTAANLIRSWVDATLSQQAPAEPTDTSARLSHPDELRLHPSRHERLRRPACPPREYAQARALAEFERGRIILLVDDRQIEGAETLIGLTETSEVTFLRLVPLVGG